MSQYEFVHPQSPQTPTQPIYPPLPPLQTSAHTSYNDKDVGLEMSNGHQRRLGYQTLVPTLAVFVLTSGLGAGVLIWLFVKRQNSVSDAFQSGYVLADEGVKRWDVMESATLRALTATSLISTLIAATSPVLMSLIAYYIARLWVEEQDNAGTIQATGPTPLQYGLLLQVLSASSVMSLVESIRYLLRNKLRRAPAPSYFRVAVILGIVVYSVTHLIGLADLWLHATTSAVLFNKTTSYPADSSPLRTSLAFNESLCDEYDFPPLSNICMTNLDGWALDKRFLTDAGQLVVSNTSSKMQAITLADADDLAVMVPPSISVLAKFKATTFGIRTSCESLNTKCKVSGRVNCSSIGINIIPTDVDKTVVNVVLVSPLDNFSDPPLTAYSTSAVKYGMSQCCATNPVSTLLQLRWSSQASGETVQLNDAIDTRDIPTISLYASCSLTIYNVTLRYDGTLGSKPWQLVPEETVQSEERFATALAAPYSWQLVTDRLMTNVQGRVMQATSVQQAMATINQEISRLSIGFVSGGFEFVPAADVQIITPTILGRYPLAPLLTFVALLFLYGLIALVIFFLSLSTSSDVILIPPQLHPIANPKDNQIPALTLTQMRLLTPLPVVAQFFSESSQQNADSRSIETSPLDMFSEHGGDRILECEGLNT
ncbi:hypothetical protein BDV93DRAFT_608342 [Ceratobasidium sp. AG-I]|nr:hypothetical protein BDV93DRAFT_608342 [Ceratobasidium sp. AG-I]